MKLWWLDELAHAGAEHLDASYVAGYERKAAFEPADDIEALLARGLDSESSIIDIGAGTGKFALAAAPLCRLVTAVDVSPAMTALLREKVAESGLANVDVVEGGFLSYVHEGKPVDFMFTRNALHQIPDFWKGIALQRMADVIRLGGILRLRDLVYDFEPSDADEHIESWLSGAVGDSPAGWTADELAEHVRGEFSTYTWLLEPMLERAGFEILDRDTRRSIYGTYTCRRTKR